MNEKSNIFIFIAVIIFGIMLLYLTRTPAPSAPPSFDTMYQKYLASNQNGKSEPLVELGRRYDKAEFDKPVRENAAKFYKLAADMGDVKAMLLLGYFTQRNLGEDKLAGHKVAFNWHHQAATNTSNTPWPKDIARAKAEIGSYYYSGKAGEQDYTKAYKWLTEAAANGAPKADSILAEMYQHGHGVKADKIQKLKHMILGHSSAVSKENASANRRLFEKTLTKQQVSKARQLVATTRKNREEIFAKALELYKQAHPEQVKKPQELNSAVPISN